MVSDKWLEQHHNLSISLFPMNFKNSFKKFQNPCRKRSDLVEIAMMANIRATSSNSKKLYCNIEIMKFRRRRNKRARYKIRNDVNEPIQLTMCIDKEGRKAHHSKHPVISFQVTC